MRTVIIQPGSYYRQIQRLEFVAISIHDGSTRNTCTMLELLLTKDAENPDADWVETEEIKHPCDIPQLLAEAGITQPGTLSPGLPAPPMQLTNNAIIVAHGPGASATALRDWEDVHTLARTMGQIENVSWQWQQANGEVNCPYCEATSGLTPKEACTIKPQAFQTPPTPWVFAQLTCWAGTDDTPGATFFIPISLSTYNKAIAK
ncbi:hypothetical protein RXV86_07475 [Alisedimentitalea sp. MJ-SS2]|nr:hypothetical protein [Alisedimentitalea sp. MJ-SS2]